MHVENNGALKSQIYKVTEVDWHWIGGEFNKFIKLAKLRGASFPPGFLEYLGYIF